jgi:modulator of FtsH protease HflK
MSVLVAPQLEIEDRPVLVHNVRPRSRTLRPWAWVLAVWVFSGTYVVSPDQQAVVTRFGAVAEPRVLPGIHYALPWPIDSVYKLKVHQLQRTVIGGDAADNVLGRVQPVTSEFLTGDQNLLNVRVVAQFSVSDPRDFLFQIEDPSRAVAETVEAELSRRLADTPVDDVLTTGKIAIQNDVLRAAQQSLDASHIGVSIASINIENASPPAEVADAFRSVASARAEAIQIVNQAEGYANDLLPRARGQATELHEQAQAYRDGKINRATGDATRFLELSAEYDKAPKVTSQRAYIEAMEQILPKLKKLIVDSDGNLDLTVVRRDDVTAAENKGSRR